MTTSLSTSSMTHFRHTPVRWLWDQRIAIGKLSVLAGDPGLGKSFLTLDLAARVSRDGLMPDGSQGPCGDALLLSAEDDPADTLLPRLRAAQADLARVHVLPATVPFTLAQVTQLRELMARLQPKLLVIDPISAYLGDADSNNNAAVRGLLAPISALAGEFGCAVIAVSHLNKGKEGGTRAMYRTMGSLAFVAAARSAWIVTRPKNDPTWRILAQVKNNLGKDRKAIRFQIDNAGRVAWDATGMDLDADDALALETDVKLPGAPSDARDDAASFLLNELREGSVRASTLYERADAAGIARSTLQRAALNLGVTRSGNASASVWSLVAQAKS